MHLIRFSFYLFALFACFICEHKAFARKSAMHLESKRATRTRRTRCLSKCFPYYWKKEGRIRERKWMRSDPPPPSNRVLGKHDLVTGDSNKCLGTCTGSKKSILVAARTRFARTSEVYKQGVRFRWIDKISEWISKVGVNHH